MMWLRMAIHTAICCSSEPVMMYENERNRQLPSPLIYGLEVLYLHLDHQV